MNDLYYEFHESIIAILAIGLGSLILAVYVLCKEKQYEFEKQIRGIAVDKEKDNCHWDTHYLTTQENLRFNKSLRWNMTYYSLLLFGGIIALYSGIAKMAWIKALQYFYLVLPQ